MKQYARFVFDSYSFDRPKGQIALRYSLDDEVQFTETITLPKDVPLAIKDEAALDRALFALHLIGGISYYKTCLPKTIEIRSGTLSPDQADFWNTVYEKGLGEFFYRNRENVTYAPGIIQFPAGTATAPALQSHHRPERTLIPVGGGKDSIVTVEQTPGDVMLLRIGGHPIIDEVARIADKPLLTLNRQLSPALFKLNEDGALNGHVPITAYVSALSVVTALLYGYTRVLMSNEKSADEGNTMLDTLEVNHQWSKSREFEQAFSGYLARWVTKDVAYESALRDLTELEVVGAFARYPQYFKAFTSCNKNWKIQKGGVSRLWCGECPKCAFVFALLAAHLPRKTVVDIFGKDLFEDAALWPLYQELLGLARHKPFECVGTADETKEAFAMALKKNPDWKDSVIMRNADAH